MLIILFVSFVILLLIGAPIAYSMGFSSLLALILSGSTFPLEVVVQRTFSMLNSYSGGMDYAGGGTFGWAEDDIGDD